MREAEKHAPPELSVIMAGIPMLPENTRAEIALTDGFILVL
jgi:hypothetical protein